MKYTKQDGTQVEIALTATNDAGGWVVLASDDFDPNHPELTDEMREYASDELGDDYTVHVEEM